MLIKVIMEERGLLTNRYGYAWLYAAIQKGSHNRDGPFYEKYKSYIRPFYLHLFVPLQCFLVKTGGAQKKILVCTFEIII